MSLRVAARLPTVIRPVLDLRWLAPLPLEDLLREATATGRVLVVDETRRSGGVSEGVLAALIDDGYTGRMAAGHQPDSYVPLGRGRPRAALGGPGRPMRSGDHVRWWRQPFRSPPARSPGGDVQGSRSDRRTLTTPSSQSTLSTASHAGSRRCGESGARCGAACQGPCSARAVVAEHGADVTTVNDQAVDHQPREDAVDTGRRREAHIGEEAEPDPVGSEDLEARADAPSAAVLPGRRRLARAPGAPPWSALLLARIVCVGGQRSRSTTCSRTHRSEPSMPSSAVRRPTCTALSTRTRSPMVILPGRGCSAGCSRDHTATIHSPRRPCMRGPSAPGPVRTAVRVIRRSAASVDLQVVHLGRPVGRRGSTHLAVQQVQVRRRSDAPPPRRRSIVHLPLIGPPSSPP